MWAFIDCDIDKKLQSLVIEGFVTTEDLESTWNSIAAEQREACGNLSVTMSLFLYKELSLMAINLREIYLSIEALKRRYHPFFHKKLDLQLECALPLDKQKYGSVEYFKMLGRYMKRTRSLVTDLELKRIEYEHMKEKGSKGPPTTRKFYMDALISLTDHAKVRIDDKIMTYEFCERIRRLNHHIKTMNRK